MNTKYDSFQWDGTSPWNPVARGGEFAEELTLRGFDSGKARPATLLLTLSETDHIHALEIGFGEILAALRWADEDKEKRCREGLLMGFVERLRELARHE